MRYVRHALVKLQLYMTNPTKDHILAKMLRESRC